MKILVLKLRDLCPFYQTDGAVQDDLLKCLELTQKESNATEKMLKNRIKLLKGESNKYGSGYFMHQSYNYRSESELEMQESFNVNHFYHGRPQSVQDQRHWYSGVKVYISYF